MTGIKVEIEKNTVYIGFKIELNVIPTLENHSLSYFETVLGTLIILFLLTLNTFIYMDSFNTK